MYVSAKLHFLAEELIFDDDETFFYNIQYTVRHRVLVVLV